MDKKASNILPPLGIIKPGPASAPTSKLFINKNKFLCWDCGSAVVSRQEYCEKCGTYFNWYAEKRLIY